MASRTRKKATPKADRHTKGGVGLGGGMPSAARRHGPFTFVVISLVIALIIAAWWRFGRDDTPLVVMPADIESLDPQIRAYIEDHIRWVREAPDVVERHVTFGQVYFANGLWAEARACFDNAVAMAPDQIWAGYYGALASTRMGENEDARRRLAATLEKGGPIAPAYFRLGALALESGDIEAAETAFQYVVDLAPAQPFGYVGLADVMNRKKNFANAVELLQKAFDLKTRDKTAHYLLGMAYRGLGRMEEARDALAKGMSGEQQYMPDPWTGTVDGHRKGVAYQLRLARWHLDKQRSDEAVKVLETALAWHPENVELLNNLAIAHMNAGRLDQARELLLRANDLGGNLMATSINLAACFLALGDLGQAAVYADRAVELGPGVAQAFITRSNVMMRQEQWTQAAEALTTAARLEPTNADVQLGLGNVCLRLGRFDEARAAFAAAADANPRLLTAHVRLSEVCLHLGAREEAETALARARQIAPDHRLVKALSERLELDP